MSENLFMGDANCPHMPRLIQRWAIDPECEYENIEIQEDDSGAWVTYKDHKYRIEQLERELADAKNLSDLDALDLAIGRQINRAARDLPMWFGIVISIEKDAGDVVMTDPDGNEFGNFEGDSFAWQISKAIDAAINGVKA